MTLWKRTPCSLVCRAAFFFALTCSTPVTKPTSLTEDSCMQASERAAIIPAGHSRSLKCSQTLERAVESDGMGNGVRVVRHRSELRGGERLLRLQTGCGRHERSRQAPAQVRVRNTAVDLTASVLASDVLSGSAGAAVSGAAICTALRPVGPAPRWV